tara:strand:+ start:5713 stop:6558 length:846 start_codon:yes stop_codon:yes gene_type:complete
MTETFGIYQGKITPLSEIKVSPLSRAYTFSDSIYEVIPFYKGKGFCFNEHISRFYECANRMGIKVDFNLVENEILALCEYVKKEDQSYVYYQISRGIDEIRSHLVKNKMVPERFGYATKIIPSTKPLVSMIVDDIRWKRCSIKSTSLLGNVMSMNLALDEGCDEIIFSHEDKITEGGASNVFFSKDGEIFTPSLKENILPGVTRDFFINALRSENILVKEQDCCVSQLDQASTIWFTSSTKGVQPVEKIVNASYVRDNNDEAFKTSRLIFNQSIKDYLSKT